MWGNTWRYHVEKHTEVLSWRTFAARHDGSQVEPGFFVRHAVLSTELSGPPSIYGMLVKEKSSRLNMSV